jgi:hypothetical protein
MSATHSIPVITRLQDNGDGGYTLYAYNNEDELIADHPISRDGEMTPEMREEILSEENPYENGYIGQDTIELKLVDGKFVLAEPLRFHAGQ